MRINFFANNQVNLECFITSTDGNGLTVFQNTILSVTALVSILQMLFFHLLEN